MVELTQNHLTGPLPPALGNLFNLRALYLKFNDFVGEIPTQITQLNKLQRLNLSAEWRNTMSISRLNNLERLDLQANNPSDLIPDSIGSLHFLIELQLGNNQLSGLIPEMPTGLGIALNLSYNRFEEPIPRTIASSKLEVLDLSHNRFSGKIPDFLTGMASLTLLALSDNQLSGVVPNLDHLLFLKRTEWVDRQCSKSFPSIPKEEKITFFRNYHFRCCCCHGRWVLTVIALFISRRYYRINDESLHSGDESSPTQVIHGFF